MRLLLVSQGLEAVPDFVGDPADMQLLFIPTAANLEQSAPWITRDRTALTSMGFNLTELDIAGHTIDILRSYLDQTDIIYLAGGNTFYLLHQLRLTGFDILVSEYAHNDGPIIGASAGACVTGPSIDPIAAFDEPGLVPELKDRTGLGFIDLVVLPHITPNEERMVREIQEEFSQYTFAPITDEQAVLVTDDDWSIIDSAQSFQ